MSIKTALQNSVELQFAITGERPVTQGYSATGSETVKTVSIENSDNAKITATIIGEIVFVESKR